MDRRTNKHRGFKKTLFLFCLFIVIIVFSLSTQYTRTFDDVKVHLFNNYDNNTVDDITKSLVIVTGASSNFFEELLNMIGSFQRYHNEIAIFVFNLGLTKHEINTINKIKNVKSEYYNFSENPYFADAAGLGGYTFKVHIINKMSKKYDVILWADTSIRILKPLSKSLMKRLLEFPIIAGSRHYVSGRSMIAFTKDSTLKYLNMTREDGRGVIGFEANILIFNFANVTAHLLLNKWVDCALHKECIVGVPILPSDHSGCQWKRNISDISFIGCHRYDQSTINLLAIKIFGKEITEQIVTPEAETTFSVERWANNVFNKYIMWK